MQSFRYSAEGKVTEVQDVGLPLKTYSYDAAGRITSVGDGTTPATTFGYDQAGRMVRATDATSKLSAGARGAGGHACRDRPLGRGHALHLRRVVAADVGTDRNGDTVTYTHEPNRAGDSDRGSGRDHDGDL